MLEQVNVTNPNRKPSEKRSKNREITTSKNASRPSRTKISFLDEGYLTNKAIPAIKATIICNPVMKPYG